MTTRLRRIPLVFAIALAVFLACLAATSAAEGRDALSAGTWYVDDDTCPATGSGTKGAPFCRIQDGVDAASAGDEVLVAAGIYTGSHQAVVYGGFTHTQVVFIEKNLTLLGGFDPTDWVTSDPRRNATTIDAEREGRAVTIRGSTNLWVTVDGFTLTGGDCTGLGNGPGVANEFCQGRAYDCAGALFAHYCALTLRNSVIVDNVSSHGQGEGAGVYIWETPSAPTVIENTQFISNAGGWGSLASGLYISGPRGPVTITNCVFRENVAHAVAGAYLYSVDKLVTIADTSFVSNTATGNWGGGAAVRLGTPDGRLLMERVSFLGNQANEHVALRVYAAGSILDAKAYIANTVFAGNRAVTPTGTSALIGSDGNFTNLEFELLHVTAADNDVPSFFYGQTEDREGYWMTVTLTNTLLVSFTNAFVLNEEGSGEALLRHTHLLASEVPTLYVTLGGTPTFTGTETLTGDPNLDEQYRLQAGSAAIDAGTSSSVTDDIDRQPRPIGAPDIGADEYQLTAFVPIVLRQAP